jgi:hypothetical protein
MCRSSRKLLGFAAVAAACLQQTTPALAGAAGNPGPNAGGPPLDIAGAALVIGSHDFLGQTLALELVRRTKLKSDGLPEMSVHLLSHFKRERLVGPRRGLRLPLHAQGLSNIKPGGVMRNGSVAPW